MDDKKIKNINFSDFALKSSSSEIVEILFKSTREIKELDDAAIQSFNQAGPFPNPPKGMLKNGKATIEWGFVVNT